MTDPELRSVTRLRRANDPLLLQPWPTTAENRYPGLFDELARLLGDSFDPRILSFGCSTGEEVRAMKSRLPHGKITGIDINPYAIAIAKARDPGGDYRLASAPPVGEKFDAVLALAVCRHGELEKGAPHECSQILPFEKFEAGMGSLDAALVEGGTLALWNSHFRFVDLAMAERYEVEGFRAEEPPLDLLYGWDNKRLEGVTESAALFRKLRD
ncbi:class I SAM-dependent methyltransferase [Altererythrobacter sp. ZODW24]|uniref:class I SAM-dependent methyltransferase n=1 Tax=Altererythrobacter sp. ZODW24 TaxID=2185142 RepID=UPI0013B42F6E|nr:class I SAM-dependent methyltransferase [Altererythrobacter sp. ZODW24]